MLTLIICDGSKHFLVGFGGQKSCTIALFLAFAFVAHSILSSVRSSTTL